MCVAVHDFFVVALLDVFRGGLWRRRFLVPSSRGNTGCFFEKILVFFFLVLAILATTADFLVIVTGWCHVLIGLPQVVMIVEGVGNEVDALERTAFLSGLVAWLVLLILMKLLLYHLLLHHFLLPNSSVIR